MTVKYFKEVKLLNIAICDDEKFQRETIRKRLEDFFKEQNSNYTVEEFSSAEQVLDYCKDKNNSTIDLLLLDIEMPGMDGISLKDNLFYQSKIKYILYISSFRERIDETFGNKTLGFLNKPISVSAFNRLLYKAYQLYQQEESLLIYDINQVPHNVRLNEIAYLQASGEWSELHFSSGKEEIILKDMLNEAIRKTSRAQVIRISKSTAVSLNYVSKMNSTTVFTKGGHKFNLGRVYKENCQEVFMNYLKTGKLEK